MITFSKSIKGSSHEENGKPMQDWSEHLYLKENMADILLLSDGHGDDKHFRSDRGSKFAVEAAKESLVEFLKDFNPVLPAGTFRQRGKQWVKDSANEDYTPHDEYEREFRQLFENIKFRWCEKVVRDWTEDAPTDMELMNSRADGKKLDLSSYENGREVIAYGCTLIAAVKTPKYWMAFQLGDGKCIAFHIDGTWYEPIPWDSRCFLNTTTSLCHEGSESFRYCYGNTDCPSLFIGSDGMDDSYMPMEKLAEFYGVVIRVVAENGIDYATEQLEKMMPVISEKGSHDDVSIAFWLDYKDVLPLSKTILSLRLNSLECDSRKQEEDKKEAENRRIEIIERSKQLKDESGVYERKRAELEYKMKKVIEDKKKAEEDFNTATFLFEDAKKNLDQVKSLFDNLEKLASENEKALENHLREVCRADEMFKQIEREIQSFEDKVSQDLLEMTNIRKILISFV